MSATRSPGNRERTGEGSLSLCTRVGWRPAKNSVVIKARGCHDSHCNIHRRRGDGKGGIQPERALEAVARRAGGGIGTLYRHFPSPRR